VQFSQGLRCQDFVDKEGQETIFLPAPVAAMIRARTRDRRFTPDSEIGPAADQRATANDQPSTINPDGDFGRTAAPQQRRLIAIGPSAFHHV
jgi:hypothetical protein